jgi:hypothetical protein
MPLMLIRLLPWCRTFSDRYVSRATSWVHVSILAVRRQTTVFSAETMLRQRSSSARFSSARANRNRVTPREDILVADTPKITVHHLIVPGCGGNRQGLVMIVESNPCFPHVWVSYPNFRDWQCRNGRTIIAVSEVKKEIPAYATFEESFRRKFTSNTRTGVSMSRNPNGRYCARRGTQHAR